MSKLFSPFTIKSITFKNRLVVSPMCQYSSKDGFSNDWHLVHLGSRAVGGMGLVITEAAAVSPEGRISPDDLGIWIDGHVPGLKRIVDFVESQGAVAGIQLAHSGRKGSTMAPWKGRRQIPKNNGGWQTLAPSSIPFNPEDHTPIALSLDGIQQIKADFVAATKRANEAGFKVAEIHAAHGYLLHQFLSPISNHRDDQYGGSFENRTRLLLEITAAVADTWPGDRPLFVRISATDWAENGWQLEDTLKLSRKLKALGVDLIDCSSGGTVPKPNIPLSPGYQVAFADAVRRTGIATGAVGMITTAPQAEEILEKGQADLIFLGRELLRDPYFPFNAARDLGKDLSWPVQYERAKL